jgi:predicted dehydrogenase
VSVAAEGSADLPPGYPFTMAYLAVFENGAIEYNSRQKPTLTVFRESGQNETPELPNPLGSVKTGLNISSANGYFLEDVYFLDCIRSGRPPEVVTPESARDTVALVRLEIESARKDAQIEVP